MTDIHQDVPGPGRIHDTDIGPVTGMAGYPLGKGMFHTPEQSAERQGVIIHRFAPGFFLAQSNLTSLQEEVFTDNGIMIVGNYRLVGEAPGADQGRILG